MSKEDGPDMTIRDPNELNDHVKVAFEDIIGEPDGVHSIDCCWRCSFVCFTGTLHCCYTVLTILSALPLAFCWACSFACTACYHIWCITPYIRCYTINLLAFKKVLVTLLDAFIAPFCETCGLCFSKIRVANVSD